MIEVGLQGDEARVQGFHPFSQTCDRDFHAGDPLFELDGFRVFFGGGAWLVSAGLTTVPHATPV